MNERPESLHGRERSCRQLRRLASCLAMVVVAFSAGVLLAANVVTDGNMEAAGITNWAHVNVTATNSSAKAADWKVSGAQSLKGTSAAGKGVSVEWYNRQTVGTINAGDTVLLSLQYASLYSSIAGGVTGTFYADLSPNGTAWTNVWTQAITPTTTRATGQLTTLDISSLVPSSSATYQLRIRFAGKTGNVNGSTIAVWWDDVILDVVGPLPITTTVGDGTDPGNTALCPTDGATFADAFTLQSSRNSIVTAATVNLGAGAAAGLSLVAITSDNGVTSYGSVSNPATDAISIPLTTNITSTTSATQYKVRVTPKGHAAAAALYTVTARVTGLTSDAVSVTYNDAGDSNVTIDNVAPGNATWGSNSAADTAVTLNWTNPGSDFSQVIVLRSTTTPITAVPVEGTTYSAGDTLGAATVRYTGTGTTTTDTNVTNGTTYSYKIFARDACGNYASGVESATLTPTGQAPALTVGTGGATVDSCDQITVRAPFTGDSPANSTTTFERATAIGGPWTSACASVTGASPRTCVLSGLTPGATYYARVTFTDGDGLSGQNPQIVGPFTTPSICAQANTAAGTASALVSACRQITVTAPFTGDGDGDGALAVEFNTANTWPGTIACAAVSGASPRQCLVTAISPSTQYWLRATLSDPDGVSGSATQVLGPLTTGVCGADASAPMILFLAPARKAVVGGTERIKVQVWESVALAATNPVRWSVDAGALSPSVTVNANYACGAGCAVYEFDVDTTVLTNGPHFVTVQATDAAANVGRITLPIVVNNTSAGKPHGGGTLLRRSFSAQLCADCHALASHTAQSAGSTKYGSWAADCLTCHTPHRTTNVGLIRTQIETPSSGLMSVELRTIDRSGGTNPQNSLLGAFDAAGAPFNDGVCEVCHTKTTHYRNDASGGDHTHYQGQRCTSCHTHDKGFKGAGCNGCHNAPPTGGKHRTKHDEVWDSTSGKTAASYDDSASHATATQYGFACANCHAGTHIDDGAPHDGTLANPWQVQVVFQGLNAGGAYAGTYGQNTETGPGGAIFSWSNGTCSNGYCHSNAAPVGGANLAASVTWNGSATTCASCHRTGGFGDGANDNTSLSKSHATHIKSTAGETNTYAFKCGDCHANVIVAGGNDPWNLATSDLADKRLHVDENKQDVAFATVGTANQAAGTYNTSARTCGSTYCHSQGTSTSTFTPPNANVAWGQTATCITCHNGNASNAPNKMATGKHGAHIDNAATYGQNVGCATCHATTVSTDTAMAGAGYPLHVNGARDVSGTSVGTWGGSGTPTCTSSRCHSSGVRVGTVQYYTENWATGSAITNCKGCHGRHTDNAFTSIAGEPNYTNVPASSKYNSHRAHVTAATDCRTCHNSTIASSLKIDGASPAKHMDFDGLPDITFAAPYAAGTYNSASRTCTVGCHGSGTPTWGGGTVLCLQCHNSAEGDALGNGIPNGISTEWATKGHGAAAGGTLTSALGGCDYCHDLSASHTPTGSTNPYRLRFAATDNTLCLRCHATGDAGIAVSSAGTVLALENSSRNVDKAHFGSRHQTGEGGKLCWDCHDPHGTATNILMVKSNVALASSTYGVPTTTKPVTFTARAVAGDFVKTTGSPRTGVCQACHDPGKGTDAAIGSTKYWRWDGTDLGGGASTHQSGTICTQCHEHGNQFAGAGGDCLGCHGGQTQGPRRAVNGDFSDGTTPNFRSHHVGNGTANSLKGTLNNFDCVVCHAEGKIVAGATDTTGQPHMDGVINLRNVDSTTAYFNYDKDAVTASAGATLSQWSSANAVWRTQTSTALDPFCLGCHDLNGATQIATLGESGATATNPFKDTQIANNYDQLVRGGVIDIKSKVSGAPPAQGTFARHAVRGQSTSIYTKYTGTLTGCNGTPTCQPVYDYGLFVQNGTDENGKPNWNDTSVMGCADCHTTDGANGSTGNAHGSSSEYLLKNNAGAATEGTMAGVSYICYRCHTPADYSSGGAHTSNNGDYQDYTAAVGTARVPSGNTGGSRFGMACMNCHGGAPGTTDGTNGYGWIHGTNQTFYVGYTTTTRNAYRFTNGGSMRFWDPNGWNTSSGTCWTLGGSGRAADQWGGCTKHSGGTGNTRKAPRPLTY